MIKEVPKLATEDEVLNEGEEVIRKRAESFKTARSAFEEAEVALVETVDDYRGKREDLQRADFAKNGLGWCQGCEKAYPKESVVFLYTEGIEKHGSHQDTYYSLVRRVQSFCSNCAEVGLSRPQGGDDQFQCFNAEKRDEEFFIFVFEKWIPISKIEDVLIDIEREDIPEREYTFGKNIDYGLNPFELTIGEEKVV